MTHSTGPVPITTVRCETRSPFSALGAQVEPEKSSFATLPLVVMRSPRPGRRPTCVTV